LLDVTNPYTVMCVACHPDDEDGLTLTSERRRWGARTVTVFVTSGEGGQNAAGPELDWQLGLVRERETERASAIQGSKPHFLRLPDFGFSKSGDEAMRVWEYHAGGHEPLLGMFVAAIRQYQPSVIITFHDTSSGHGQHQATGRLLLEALDAAADSSRFAYAGPAWTVGALYLGGRAARDGTVHIDGDWFDPLRGETISDLAFEALQEHATQGPWRREFLPHGVDYTLTKGASRITSGLGSPLTRDLPLPPARSVIEPALVARGGAPLAATLWAAYRRATTAEDRERLAEAILAALGIYVELHPERVRMDYAATESVQVAVTNTSANEVSATVEAVTSAHITCKAAPVSAVLPGHRTLMSIELCAASLPPGADWTRLPPGADSILGTLDAAVTVATGEGQVTVRRAAVIELLSPLALRVVPGPVGAATPSWPVLVLTSRAAAVRVTAGEIPGLAAGVTLGAGQELKVELPPTAVQIRIRVDTARLELPLVVPPPVGEVRLGGRLRVGHVRSYEDTISTALERLGIDAVDLRPATLGDRDLHGFDAIVIDNRAYMRHPELARVNSHLLDYAAGGGTLLVLYHKAGEYAPSLAPYPLTVGRGRVADERAPVAILDPTHVLLVWPNQITEADFAGWVQERGLYFPSAWDAHYSALLETHDTGEEPLRGGLLVARYGKGWFVYTSLALYRQLRASVPGGYRLFANMLSLSRSSSEQSVSTVADRRRTKCSRGFATCCRPGLDNVESQRRTSAVWP
jgi:LmbE family N-acetylglucosaminyl deacetylase